MSIKLIALYIANATDGVESILSTKWFQQMLICSKWLIVTTFRSGFREGDKSDYNPIPLKGLKRTALFGI